MVTALVLSGVIKTTNNKKAHMTERKPTMRVLKYYAPSVIAALILVVIAEITWNLMKHWPNAP